MTRHIMDTIVAPATVPGTGAISIIRMSGPNAFEIADAVVKLKNGTISNSKAYSIHFGNVFSSGNDLLDEVLVSVFRAPHSYTGEDSVEISTHASSYIVSEIIAKLISAGARYALPGEFTQRAYVNGKMDLSQAEAVADVISSTTKASHRLAMQQLKGSYSKELESLRDKILEMTSLLELELDFSEEDVEFADRKQLLALVEGTLSHIEKLAGSFKTGNMIKNGIPIVIAGNPNSGKSTLLNSLIGDERAIVSDIPGTTRDTVEELLNLDGFLFRFIDTAGIRSSSDTIERLGIERTFRKISEAEIVISLLDGTASKEDNLEALKAVTDCLNPHSQKLIILINKIDKISNFDINNTVTYINAFVKSLNYKSVILYGSAKTQNGLEELKNTLSGLEKDIISGSMDSLVTNMRHYEALTKAAVSLRAVKDGLAASLPGDLVAEDLRDAIFHINSILGSGSSITPETVLHDIFAKHCIGK